MTNIYYEGRELTCAPQETVLECLQRSGVPVPSSCRAGACQSCLVRAVAGAPPPEAQKTLKDTLRVRGYFLSCIARPTGDLTVALADAELRAAASVHSLEPLSATVVRLRLSPQTDFAYAAGQFLNLARPDGLTRSYSLASLPGRDPFLELHIRLYPGGQMSTYVQTLRPGDQVHLRGPAGDCFYVGGRPEQPMLLLGTGTGLAPLYGIVQEALRSGHRGPLVLLHGAASPEGLYLDRELRELATAHPNLTYLPSALRRAARSPGQDPPAPEVHEGPLDALLAARYPSLRGFRVFLCGSPELVIRLRKQAFLAGASRKDIASDAFLTAPPPAASPPPPVPPTATSRP